MFSNPLIVGSLAFIGALIIVGVIGSFIIFWREESHWKDWESRYNQGFLDGWDRARSDPDERLVRLVEHMREQNFKEGE